MDKIVVKKILAEEKCIKIVFDTSDSLQQYFKSNTFEIHYSVSIANIPYSVAVIPFVSNILPIVWITDAELVLQELDEDFYKSIENIKRGYDEIHPQVSFLGKISCHTIKNVPNGDKSLCFFSGGVDAVATLCAHMDSHPTLFTIWGADIKYEDSKSWNNVQCQVESIANQYGLDNIYGQCNFRNFINEDVLSQYVRQLGAQDDWWHGFQHGLGLIGLAAPIANKYGYASLYIASSFTIRERNLCTCASDPRIDNEVRYCGVQVYHDQFEFNRQQKLQHIVEFVNRTNIKIPLRVCWQSWSGKNCCRCEKCYRTVCGLIAEGANPRDYGFPITKNDIQRMQFELRNVYHLSTMQQIFWEEIKERINTNSAIKIPRQYRWLTNFSIVNTTAPKSIFSKFCRYVSRHENVANRIIIAIVNTIRRGGYDYRYM